MNPLNLKSFNEIQILGEVTDLTLIPEEEFFALQKNDIYKENSIPLGSNAQVVFYGKLFGQNAIIEQGNQDLYIITNVENFGMALLHYILDNVNLEIELSNTLPLKKIFNIHKEVLSMAGSLREMINQGKAGAPPQGTNNGQQFDYYNEQTQQETGGGIVQKKAVDLTKLTYFTRRYGYVLGYVCNVGPAISMTLKKTKVKNKTTNQEDINYNVVATQSKPSKVIRVLTAIPKGSCFKNGMPATPDDIYNGDIDFNEDDKDLIYFSWKPETAIAYIGALGKALPEYGPTHGARDHYKAEDILDNKPDVGFVEIVTRQNKRKDRKQGEDLIWSLKSTKRRTLFTPGNFIPLKIVKHIPTKCATAADAMNINKIAFSHWTKRVANSNESRLELALNHTSSLIFKREYVIGEGKDAKKVEGIGSVYFMESDTIKLGDSEVPRVQPSYIPWYTITKRGETPVTSPVTMIANKIESTSKEKKTVRYVNDYLTIESVTESGYKEYKPFLNYVERCMTIDELKALAKERKRAVPGGGSWDPNTKTSYQSFIHKSAVANDVEAIVHRYSKNQVLANN